MQYLFGHIHFIGLGGRHQISWIFPEVQCKLYAVINDQKCLPTFVLWHGWVCVLIQQCWFCITLIKYQTHKMFLFDTTGAYPHNASSFTKCPAFLLLCRNDLSRLHLLRLDRFGTLPWEGDNRKKINVITQTNTYYYITKAYHNCFS